jgi:hypothetical protein
MSSNEGVRWDSWYGGCKVMAGDECSRALGVYDSTLHTGLLRSGQRTRLERCSCLLANEVLHEWSCSMQKSLMIHPIVASYSARIIS